MNKITFILLCLTIFYSCGPTPKVSFSFGPEGIASEGSGERLEASADLSEDGYGASGDGEHIRASARVVCEDDYRGLCASFGPVPEICFEISEELGEKLCRPTEVLD